MKSATATNQAPYLAAPVGDERQVLAGWRDALAGAPDEITSHADLWSLPAAPEVPAAAAPTTAYDPTNLFRVNQNIAPRA